MKLNLMLVSFLVSSLAWAQQVVVDVKARPALSFKIKTSDIKGFAIQKGNSFEAQNIVVSLTNLKTGMELRDTHTKKYLEVEKFPEAILISAKGEGGTGSGVIKIKGIEQKISGTYKIEGSNLVAEFPLKLSDFKITGVKYMSAGVDDDIKLAVTVPVKAATGPVTPPQAPPIKKPKSKN